MTRKLVDVAAGVLLRADGAYLLGQRAPDTVYAGYWEFPGGKVERGESPAQALCRELEEELGIHVTHLRPWLRREHLYEHAHVRLHFFEVAAWQGTLNDRVHSALAWVAPGDPVPAPMLPANGPILKALRLPRIMGITQATAIGAAEQLSVLERALQQGLGLVQVREAALDAGERERFARAALDRVRASGGLLVVNSDLELARRIGADGCHLTAPRLLASSDRPEFEWVGASCHTRAELEHAAALGLDYALLGPVQPTATHPDQAGLGWARFGELIEGLPIPVFALGGLTQNDMSEARDAGAHGIAAIRGVWGPKDA
ncbi:Nudix family hydrolase [Thauera sp.]|uniref:Nudix family hydrolase n=1 Tax=Thauera sp. TaxID=1905334 RepID=UPI00258C0A61|nr:Nudix family hydrolase [Thauera sp.]